METIESMIACNRFWQGLPQEFLPIVVQTASHHRFGLGDLIFREHQEADHLHLVHKGKVALEAFVPGRGVVTLQVLGPGEALGWAWLFAPYRWQYGARSVDATEVVSFSASSLRQLAEQNPAFGRELVTRTAKVLLERMQATRVKLREFQGPDAGHRVGDCLGDVEVDEETEPYTHKPV